MAEMPTLVFRPAREADLAAIVALLADDELGAVRERAADPLPACYRDAFAAIAASTDHLLLVGERAGQIVSCLQISFIPGLSHEGSWRALIEAVRVARHLRGHGIGEAMMRHAIALARERRCRLVQLTTDKARPDAQRFYRRLGFAQSHEGMKLDLMAAGNLEPASS